LWFGKIKGRVVGGATVGGGGPRAVGKTWYAKLLMTNEELDGVTIEFGEL